MSGILVQDGCVLLVANQWGDRTEWTLPGGMVEPEEAIHDALKREFREETGLTIGEYGQLAYVVQSRRAVLNEEVLILAFPVQSADGELAVTDDRIVSQARFVPRAELSCTVANPANLMPLAAFLNEDAQRGTFYHFDDRDGEMQLRFRK